MLGGSGDAAGSAGPAVKRGVCQGWSLAVPAETDAAEPASPARRSGHMSVVHRGRMMIYGGYFEGDNGHEHYPEMGACWSWDPTRKQWSRELISNHPMGLERIRGISGASAVNHNGTMVMFGGFYAPRTDMLLTAPEELEWWDPHVSECHFLQLDGLEWVDRAALRVDGHPPPPRDKHAAVLYNSRMIVWGGWGPDCPACDLLPFDLDLELGHGWFGDLSVLDLTTLNSERRVSWSTPQQAGECPSGRAAHSLTVVGDTAILFGGRTQQGRTAELFRLDLNTMVWREVRPAAGAKVPEARSWHSATLLDPLRIFYFGGLSADEGTGSAHFLSDAWIFDTKHEVWTEVQTPTAPAIPRLWHTSMRVGPDVLLFGGSVKKDDHPNGLRTRRVQTNTVIQWRFGVPTLERLCIEALSRGRAGLGNPRVAACHAALVMPCGLKGSLLRHATGAVAEELS